MTLKTILLTKNHWYFWYHQCVCSDLLPHSMYRCLTCQLNLSIKKNSVLILISLTEAGQYFTALLTHIFGHHVRWLFIVHVCFDVHPYPHEPIF